MVPGVFRDLWPEVWGNFETKAKCSPSPGSLEMRYKIWESFAGGLKEKTGLVLLVLAGAYLGENLDEVACYTDGMLKEDRLCTRLALFAQSSEIRAEVLIFYRQQEEKRCLDKSQGFLCVRIFLH